MKDDYFVILFILILGLYGVGAMLMVEQEKVSDRLDRMQSMGAK